MSPVKSRARVLHLAVVTPRRMFIFQSAHPYRGRVRTASKGWSIALSLINAKGVLSS